MIKTLFYRILISTRFTAAFGLLLLMLLAIPNLASATGSITGRYGT